jgi:hypothetical protein
MAKAGFTSGVENVRVLVPVNVPFNVIMPPIVSGDVVTVPPMNELAGSDQSREDRLMTVLPSTSPL